MSKPLPTGVEAFRETLPFRLTPCHVTLTSGSGTLTSNPSIPGENRCNLLLNKEIGLIFHPRQIFVAPLQWNPSFQFGTVPRNPFKTV